MHRRKKSESQRLKIKNKQNAISCNEVVRKGKVEIKGKLLIERVLLHSVGNGGSESPSTPIGELHRSLEEEDIDDGNCWS